MSSGSLSLGSGSRASPLLPLWCPQACTGCGCLSEVTVPFSLGLGAAQIIYDDLIASSFNSVTKSTKTFVLIRGHVQCWEMATCSWCQQLTCGTWTLRSHLHGGREHFQPARVPSSRLEDSDSAFWQVLRCLPVASAGVCAGILGRNNSLLPTPSFPSFQFKICFIEAEEVSLKLPQRTVL